MSGKISGIPVPQGAIPIVQILEVIRDATQHSFEDRGPAMEDLARLQELVRRPLPAVYLDFLANLGGRASSSVYPPFDFSLVTMACLHEEGDIPEGPLLPIAQNTTGEWCSYICVDGTVADEEDPAVHAADEGALRVLRSRYTLDARLSHFLARELINHELLPCLKYVGSLTPKIETRYLQLARVLDFDALVPESLLSDGFVEVFEGRSVPIFRKGHGSGRMFVTYHRNRLDKVFSIKFGAERQEDVASAHQMLERALGSTLIHDVWSNDRWRLS
jgi:hypothetical protein